MGDFEHQKVLQAFGKCDKYKFKIQKQKKK